MVRAAGPDLAPVDQPTAVGLGRAGRGGEHVGARIRLAQTDAKAQFAGSNLRQDFFPDLLLAIAQDDRAALAVGGRMGAGRRVRRQHLLGHDIAFELGALVPAVFLGPGHADPTLGSDLAAELARERALAVMRGKGPGFLLLAQKRADLLAQFLGLGRQFDRVEAKAGGHRVLTIARAYEYRGSSSVLSDEGPKLVGAGRRDHPAEALGPDRLVAELLAPRPQPARRMVQRMLVGEAHRAVH